MAAISQGRILAAWAAVLVCLVIPLMLAAPAAAKRGLTTGFADDLFKSSNPSARAQWLGRAKEARAGMVRLNFY